MCFPEFENLLFFFLVVQGEAFFSAATLEKIKKIIKYVPDGRMMDLAPDFRQVE